MLERIKIHFPEVSGYGEKEAIAKTDSIVRVGCAKILEDFRMKMEGERTHMSEKYLMDYLWKLAKLLTRFREIEGKIRHVSEGYAGTTPPVQVNIGDLPQLYGCDLELISTVKQMQESVQEFNFAIDMYQDDVIKEMLTKYEESATKLEECFEKRHQIMMNSPKE